MFRNLLSLIFRPRIAISVSCEREELIHKYKVLQRKSRSLPAHPADNKKFTFVRYADDWLVGVCGRQNRRANAALGRT